MSDIIHFIQVEGGRSDVLEGVADEMKTETQTDDNIIITSDVVEPLTREEAKDFLQQFADALDMELVEQ